MDRCYLMDSGAEVRLARVSAGADGVSVIMMLFGMRSGRPFTRTHSVTKDTAHLDGVSLALRFFGFAEITRESHDRWSREGEMLLRRRAFPFTPYDSVAG